MVGGGGVGWRWRRRCCRVFIYPGKSNRCRSAVGEVRGSMEGFKKPSCKIEVPHMLLMAAWPQKKENNKETPVYGGKISPLALLFFFFFFRLSGILPLAFSSLLFCYSSWASRRELALRRGAGADPLSAGVPQQLCRPCRING